MKKTYQKPHTTVLKVAAQGLIANSMTISKTKTATSETVVDVKQSSYNVWDDDWSE